MSIHPLVEAAITGSALYFYDNTYLVKWDNMLREHKTDWLLFFDMVRDDANYDGLTEQVLKAIVNGFCPNKVNVLIDSTVPIWSNNRWIKGRQCRYKDFWMFQVGKTVATPNVLPLNECYSHYGVNNFGELELIKRKKIVHRSTRYNKFMCFTHPVEAWQFLFQFMLNQVNVF
jgi:hypothetical protein